MFNLQFQGSRLIMNQISVKPYAVIVLEQTSQLDFSLFVNLFNQLKLSFVLAPDPESAIFHAEYTQPDLIIVPMNQYKSNSTTTYRQLKTAEIMKNIPLLWMKDYSEVKIEIQNRLSSPLNFINFTDYQNCSQEQRSSEATLQTLKQQLLQQQEQLLQLKAENTKLKRLAILDDLTQLANRRQFYEELQQQWENCQADYLSLILCDVDFFKSYNDTYGHLAGDYCLQQIATAIATAVKRVREPEPYLVARYGGEEFAIILPHLDLDNACKVAEEIQGQIQSLNIPHSQSPMQLITSSSGVACCVPEDKIALQNLISAADQAMYQAKAQGRNRVRAANSTR